MKIKKGDNVIVKTGKSKGQTGTVLKVFADTNKVVVSGIAKVKKNLKPRTRDAKGTTVEVESAINASNVMVVDPKTGKGTRVGKKSVNGKNIRIAKKSGQELK